MKNTLRLALLAAVLPAAGYSTSIVFPDFSNSNGLKLGGDAATVVNASNQSVLRLTTAAAAHGGAAFSNNKIALNSATSFSTAFSFQMTDGGGIPDPDGTKQPGADGIVFTVQSVENNSGAVGVGLGYAGLSPSIGIEFDTWDDSAAAGFPTVNDPNGNHVGIDVNGNVDSVVTDTNLPGFLNNGQVWYSWVEYNGGTNDLQVRLNTINVRPTDPILDLDVNLSADLGSPLVFAGFTAATGGAWENHDILGWQFNSSFSPIDTIPTMSPVPEPSTYGIARVGTILAILACKRR